MSLKDFKNHMEWSEGKVPSDQEIKELEPVFYFNSQFYYHLDKKQFFVSGQSSKPIEEVNAYKYLKGLYPKINILEREVLNFFPPELDEVKDMDVNELVKQIQSKSHSNEDVNNLNYVYHIVVVQQNMYKRLATFRDEFLAKWESSETFNYFDAFNLEMEEFRRLVFQTISIGEMFKNLDSKRISVDGIPVKRKTFKPNGEFDGYKTYDNIYEVYEVESSKLISNLANASDNVDSKLYAVKCWCTSTNKEHWLWIEPEYKDNPLEAIASTFRVHKNLVPHIKELKRQGDVLLMEFDEPVEPEGTEMVALTKDQYFSLLTCEA